MSQSGNFEPDIEERELDEIDETEFDFAARTNTANDLGSVIQTSTSINNDSTELDDMLQNAHIKKGILAPIERLPLAVKLILLLIVSTVGMLVLGALLIESEAKTIRTNRRIDKSSGAITGTGNLIHELQTERAQALLTISSGGDSAQLFYYDQQIASTNIQIKSYLSVLDKQVSFSSRYKEARTQVREIVANLSTLRAQVSNLTRTGEEALNSYSDIVTTLQNILTGYISQSSGADSVSFNVLVRLKESVSISQAYMTVQLSQAEITKTALDTFVGYLGETKALRKMFEAIGSQYVLDVFHLAFPETNDALEDIQQQIINDPGNRNIGAQTYYVVSNIRLDKLYKLENILGKIITDESDRVLHKSRTRIAVVVVVIVIFWTGSIIAALLFSQTITGPWRRMVDLQNMTIKKFVPKGFLKMLKVYKLADLTLGKALQRDLSVMFMDIRGCNALMDEMKPNDVFNFLNKYLEKVGPVVRKYGGYIDKYMGDGFMAVFPSYGSSLRCSLELHEAIKDFNTANEQSKEFPAVNAGIGVHAGKVLVGTVGESDRIDGQIMSDTVNLAARLESLTKAFKVKVLTSQDALKKIKGDQVFVSRPLGYVRVKGKKRHMKIVELLDSKSDSKKIESLKDFTDAINQMRRHEYTRSLELLTKIVESDPDDYAAARMRDHCTQSMNHLEKKVAQIAHIHNIIAFPELWDDFEQFCREEQSDENYRFWMAISQEYNKAQNNDERLRSATNILNFYLVDDAPFKVNTSAARTAGIVKILNEHRENGAPLSPNLFADLKSEIENLMTDTFTRYKRTTRIRDILKKTLGPCIINLNEEDTL